MNSSSSSFSWILQTHSVRRVKLIFITKKSWGFFPPLSPQTNHKTGKALKPTGRRVPAETNILISDEELWGLTSIPPGNYSWKSPALYWWSQESEPMLILYCFFTISVCTTSIRQTHVARNTASKQSGDDESNPTALCVWTWVFSGLFNSTQKSTTFPVNVQVMFNSCM